MESSDFIVGLDTNSLLSEGFLHEYTCIPAGM